MVFGVLMDFFLKLKVLITFFKKCDLKVTAPIVIVHFSKLSLQIELLDDTCPVILSGLVSLSQVPLRASTVDQ